MAGAGDGGGLRGAPLVEAAPAPRVQRLFAWYAERLLRRSFAALRVLPGSDSALGALAAPGRPTLLVTTHASWWDPIVVAWIWRRHLVGRPLLGAMDLRSLERFRFFRRLGVFGIDPERGDALDGMLAYLRREIAAAPGTTIALTPQGRFTDPRDPIVLRPGAAKVAAELDVGCAVAVAIEYAFWTDRKPELFLAAARVAAPERASTAGWQRRLHDALGERAASLADAVRSRDPRRFEQLGSAGSGNHALYDLWLRATGRGRSIDLSHRSPARDGAAEGMR